MSTPEELRDKFTYAQAVCVDGEPDARTIWLKVEGQSFCISGYQDNKEEADWMRLMLGKALARLIEIEGKSK